MTTGSGEYGMQADVVFVIESTASNGAYLKEFKTNYIIPTLEYFSQGGIEDREFASVTSQNLYAIVTYNAADCIPCPFTEAFGSFSNPHEVLVTLEKLDMVGGKGESHAHIAEGLATAIHCFEDMQLRREPNVASQKHCILICNSPPYQVGVTESATLAGLTVEQLAALFPERNISLSILSPRKTPSYVEHLYNLFKKAGGDLQSSQTKNYTKDPRHLVLLRNYNLKESPVSSTTAATAAAASAATATVPGAQNPAQIALSPLQSNDSPTPNQTQNIAVAQQQQQQQQQQSVTQQQAQQQQGPPTSFRNQTTPQNINSVQQQVNQQQQQQQQQQSMSAQMGGRPQFNPQISAPPNYHPATMGPRAPHPRAWMRPPFMSAGMPTGPQTTAPPPPPPTSTQQSSALIAQLSQPPNAMGLNVQPFAQRMEGTPNAAMTSNAQNQQQQQQLNQHQQQQLRINMNLQQQLQQQQNAVQQQNAQQQQNAVQQQQQQQQQNAVQQQQNATQQQATMGMQSTQSGPSQPGGPQINVSAVNQSMASQVPQTVPASQASTAPGATVSGQMAHPQQGNGTGGQDRTVIWKGMLEWVEKTKNPNDAQKQTWQVPCQVSSTSKDGEPEVKAESWPVKLIMQLMPKVLIGNIGQAYLKNSKSVVFYPSACDALESLIKVMSNGFAGCVHFTSTPTCNIKVLLLLYTAEKRTFIGFIPNDQQLFVDRLRKVIQQQKTTHAMIRQTPQVALRPTGPGTAGAGTNVMPGGVPNAGISQSGILMSQTNTMTMGGGQITQNVIPNNGLPQQSLAPTTVQQTQLNIQAVGGLSSAGVGPQSHMNTGVITQQQQLEMNRQQNLLKIHQLQQTLEAAQQQEAQYKSQEIQQNLEHAQAQEMQYKQLEQAQQAQRGLNPGPGMQAPQQANAQRMMRPVINSTMGLRHLLQQQQQPPFRQVLGMQQQMVGPRGQMAPRPMAPGNPQNQQFDEVSNYDFLG